MATSAARPAVLAAVLAGTLVASIGLLPASAVAQSTLAVGSPAEPGEPAWIGRWSPLSVAGELPSPLPGGEAVFPDLLTLPAPRVGLFWTAGNPGALPRELHDARAEFRLARSEVEGGYRRPMDPGEEDHNRASGLAWGRLGERGAAVGRVVWDDARVGSPAHSGVNLPYSGSPFAVLDTLGDTTDRTAVRLDGAGGWSAGPLGLGLAVGFEFDDARTVESPVPRTLRTATPAAAAGVSLEVPGAGLRVGAFGRWRRAAHSVSILSLAAGSRAYPFQGYAEPVAIDLVSTFFDRRLERTAWTAGAGAAGTLGALSWAAFLQRETLSEERFNPRANDPLTDEWDTEGWTGGGAGQLAAAGGALLATLDLRHTALDGEGRRADLDGIAFRSEDRRSSADLELRLRPGAGFGPGRRAVEPAGEGWEAALRLGLVRATRHRRDAVEEARTEIDSWTTSGALEVARRFGRLALGAGGVLSGYAPTAAIPDPEAIGPRYAAWIHPGLALESESAFAWAAGLTARLRAAPGTRVWLRGRYGTASAVDPLPDVPSGDRESLVLEAGVVLGGS